MPSAHTVMGEIPVNKLGITFPHEHVVLAWGAARSDMADAYNPKALTDTVCADLGPAVKNHKLATIVDAGPPELGRDVEVQRMVSQRLGINIIAATGHYKVGGGGIPLVWQFQDIEVIEEHFVEEITKGVGPNKVKCGVIKLASSDDFTNPAEEKIFRAGARAAKRTGCPIITHSDPTGWAVTNVGKKQLDIILSEGVDPSKVMLGHIDGTPNLNYLLELVKRGCYVAFDRIGGRGVVPDEGRAGLVGALCVTGYANHVLLSMDHQGVWLPKKAPMIAAAGKYFSYLQEKFVPMLRQGGVKERDIDQMLVGNPQNLLGF
ncbi:MAG: hypothetical protein EXR67_07080 [Dehalococcoidia bacterium]|nr:hypothetical protein [Dehalococcoidia bacterium]